MQNDQHQVAALTASFDSGSPLGKMIDLDFIYMEEQL